MKHWGDDIVVAERMVAPVHTVHESARLPAAAQRMAELGISALPVVDDTSLLGGLITRSDLLRIGRMRQGRGGRRVLTLPDERVGEHMTSPVEVSAPAATLADAAGRMVRRRVRRLYVTRDRNVEGVLTTRELLLAVSEARVARCVGDLVRGRLATVRSGDPLGLVLDRLVSSEQRAVVVVDDGLPVGVFASREALAAKDATPSQLVDEWMSSAIVCVAPGLPAFRAAAQAAETSPRALLVTEGHEVIGLLSGIDLAALVAGAA